MRVWISLVCVAGCGLTGSSAFCPSRPSEPCRRQQAVVGSRRGASTTTNTSSNNNNNEPQRQGLIALTREDGKNGKIQQALATALADSDDYRTVELPCIAHADGPDVGILAKRLRDDQWTYVIVTSPEAAKVLAGAWEGVRDTPPPVAAVGKATEQVLRNFGIDVCFTPSKATAEVLAVELPVAVDSSTSASSGRVLYPASAKAKATLAQGLTARGFDVVRLDTYDTVTARWTTAQQEIARQCRVACFASPSSVEGWLQNSDSNSSVLAACIGETSAQACREEGWPEERIFYPDQPGIAGWVEAVQEATKSLTHSSSHI
jgi:uroporphyrinogen-III synthase